MMIWNMYYFWKAHFKLKFPLIWKNTKKAFPSSESKAKGILEIIHSDVCGPMSSSSLNGYVYYVSFIDDFLGRRGYTLWRTKVKYSASSRNSKPWSRTTQKRRSRPFDQIMEDNSHQMNSKTYAKNKGLRGSYTLLIIHNRMGLQKGIIELSWKL